MKSLLFKKINESLKAVLPLTVVVTVTLLFFKTDLTTIMTFLLGSLMLMVGLVVFSLGAESSMMKLAKEIGAYIVKKRSLAFFIFISGLIGFLITFSEPSVWVLGEQFKSAVPLMTMVVTIALGSSLFAIISLLRIAFKIPLNILIVIIFGSLFGLAFLMPPEFIAVAFDAGAFSTGPMAVPFLISLGFGVVSTQVGSTTEDSFGILGITSIGPIFAVLILGLFYKNPTFTPSTAAASSFIEILLDNMLKVGIAIMPFILFFIVFQLSAFKYPKKRVGAIFIGFFLTYAGLVIFLTGATVGFINIGTFLGEEIAGLSKSWYIIIFGLLFSMVIVLAEPSVVVLVNQVEEATDGVVRKKIMLPTLSVGVSIMIALAMTRIAYNISIWWFIIPAYTIIVILSFFVPKMFTGIALDSGGAVSGALASTFLVSFAIGAASFLYPGQDILVIQNAFGVMAFLVIAPLLSIQILGLIYKQKTKVKTSSIEEDVIIELEEG